MPFLKPCDSVYKISTLPRWVRDWINESNVNYSGVIQQTFIQIIKEKDPLYFAENEKNLAKRTTRKQESTSIIMS